jgi:pimeloyl-ACP methyl ester carboxylesterase
VQRLYAFSGLGADKRIFGKLDLSGFEVVHVEWIAARRNEDLESYALRLADHYQIPRQGANVLGVSFGGICVSQLAHYYDFEKTIVLSSAKTKFELPKLYTWTKHLSLDKVLSALPLQKPNPAVDWLFGIKTANDKALLAEIIRDSDPKFMQWAVSEIRRWENTRIPINCLHIHGDQDRIIPIRNVDYSIRIKGGGHFMTWNKAEEISFHIRNFLV